MSKIFYDFDDYENTSTTFTKQVLSSSTIMSSNYGNISQNVTLNQQVQIDSTIERVAQWFLSMSSMSNKKLQKMCYYAYCWFIVFFNDIETITEDNASNIRVLCPDRFQAWIHGPVLPALYHKYKKYGWHDIPRILNVPQVTDELGNLLQQVWQAYGDFSADELEALSHQEMPWKKARKGIQSGDACSNEISTYDILMYYSSLG